jgi:iron complex transport system permease protein
MADLFIGSHYNNLVAQSDLFYEVFLKLRAPQTLTAVIVGGGLAISGLLLQILFKNFLAGPSIIGITSGANLGVSVLIFVPQVLILDSIFFLESIQVFASLAGAFLILSFLMLLEKKVSNSSTLLITGLMISFFISSVVSTFEYFGNENQIQKFIFWGFGTLSNTNLLDVVMISIVVLSLITYNLGRIDGLKIFEINENLAKQQGYNPRRIRFDILVTAGIIVALITAYCGPIAFIGIAAPILTRILLKTPNLKLIFVSSFLVGAILMVSSDLISKTPWQQGVIPINVVTSLIGAPIILWLLIKQKINRI